MKFILSLIAIYVYFSFALLDSFKSFSYYRAAVSNTFVVKNANPERTEVAKVAMAKTASFVEKSGLPL